MDLFFLLHAKLIPWSDAYQGKRNERLLAFTVPTELLQMSEAFGNAPLIQRLIPCSIDPFVAMMNPHECFDGEKMIKPELFGAKRKEIAYHDFSCITPRLIGRGRLEPRKVEGEHSRSALWVPRISSWSIEYYQVKQVIR